MRLNPQSLAKVSSRHPWRTIGAWVVAIVAMGMVSATLLSGVLSDDMEFTNNPESERAQQLLDTRFGANSEDTEFMVVSSSLPTSHPLYADFVTGLKSDVEGLGPDVVGGPVATYVDAEGARRQLFTPDLHGVLVLVQLVGPAKALVADLADAVPAAAPEGFEARVLAPEELAQLAGAEPGPAAADPPEAVVLVTSPTSAALDPAFPDAVRAVETVIVRRAGSSLASSPYSAFDAKEQASSMIAADLRTTLVPVPISEISTANVDRLRAVARRDSNELFTVQVAGQAALFTDFMKLAEEDMRKAESIGLGVALIVLDRRVRFGRGRRAARS